jgi:TPR repeat protein
MYCNSLKLYSDGRFTATRCWHFSLSPSSPKVSAFLRRSIQHFKFAVDQRNIDAQYNFGFCLQNNEGVPIDLKATAHHFKLAVDQSFVEAKYR